MFGIDSSELLLVAIVALVVIGPKDLPKAMRVVGYWVGRARGVARQFRAGFDNIVREAELEEMEKKWAAENERIMREHPQPAADQTTSDHTPFDQAGPDPVSEDPPVEMAPVSVEKPQIVAGDRSSAAPRIDDAKAAS